MSIIWGYAWIGTRVPGLEPMPWRTLALISAASGIVFVLGLIDDLRMVSPRAKFATQALAGVLLYVGGFRVVHMHFLFGAQELGFWVGLAITVFWVLLITNSFNLLDGLDGLAAGSATFATLTMFAVHLAGGNAPMALLTAVLAGAILGFLPSNFNPASIFMGDCGSLFVGFLLSAMALPSSQKSPTLIAVAIPLMTFGLPVLDTVLSVSRRFLRGRPLFGADREHIHHKLMLRGLTHRQAVIVLYAVSCAFAFFSLLLLNHAVVGVVLAVVAVAVVTGVQRLGYSEFSELRRIAQRTVEQKQIMANNIAIRRAAEDLRKARDEDEIRTILTTAFENNEFDGFEVSYFASAGPEPYEFVYRWERAATTANRTSWSLNVDLVGSNPESRGRFSVYRTLNLPLMLDINCMTSSEFSVALADALERAFEHAARPVRARQLFAIIQTEATSTVQ
jgi:UDP-GlcNAc:undecaprenyl-phosphate GlcNAc-1-phosphate transferase